MPAIRPATPADLVAVGRSLSAAFAADPVWTWLTGDPRRYARGASRFFTADARSVMADGGEVLVDEAVGGVACWCTPGRWRSTFGQTARLTPPSLLLFGPRVLKALGAQMSMEKVHPSDTPHWYLSLLGTDPAHQGKGIGSALVSAVTDRCDREGVAAYLESSKESNIAFYARHGFEVTAEHPLGRDGPPVWLMWREPR